MTLAPLTYRSGTWYRPPPFQAPVPAQGAGSWVWHLPSECLAHMPLSYHAAGVAFARKQEFHITLLARNQMDAVVSALGEELAHTWMRDVLTRWDWRFRLRSRLWHVQEADDMGAGTKHSVVLRIDQPAQVLMRRVLWKRHGVTLGYALPHITLYTASCERGIGIPNRRAWRLMQPKALERFAALS